MWLLVLLLLATVLFSVVVVVVVVGSAGDLFNLLLRVAMAGVVVDSVVVALGAGEEAEGRMSAKGENKRLSGSVEEEDPTAAASQRMSIPFWCC